MVKVERWQLLQRQSLPLEMKEKMSETRIRNWYEHWEGRVYVSFSGGKDSTVLLHLVRRFYPEVPAVFVNTGLEYPEIIKFVRETPNVTWLQPKLTFAAVLEKWGFPVVSKEQAQYIYEIRNTKSDYMRRLRLEGKKNKRGKISGKLSEKWKYLLDAPFKISEKCCDIMKKAPSIAYEKKERRKPFIGAMASDSFLRRLGYMRRGCNAFGTKRPASNPLAFWLEEDVWGYLKKYRIPYSPIYDKGYTRTGCMFCMFGVHMEKGENRFQKMERTHPRQYKYCMEKLGCGAVLDYMGVAY